MKYYYIVLVLMLIVFTIQVQNINSDDHVVQEEWIEPNAWESKITIERRTTDYVEASKDNTKLLNNGMALIYLKKIISTLFQREKLKYNEKIGSYCRSLKFNVFPTQLIQLESTNDPRELERILQELILNAQTTNCLEKNPKSGLNFLGLIWDIFKDLWQLLKTFEVRLTILGGVFLAISWVGYRRVGIFRMLAIIIGGSVVFGFFITYLECNAKLQVEEVLELMPAEKPGWFSGWLWSSKKSEKQEMREKLTKSTKVRLPYCRPDHVLLSYANDIFLKQLQLLIDKCASTLSTFSEDYPFPLNIIFGGMLLSMIAYMVKLTFMYVINPSLWSGYFNASHTHTPVGKHAPQIHAPSTEDRISGENLKTLLQYMKSSSEWSVINRDTKEVSGVQVILEHLEAVTPNNTPSSSKSNSPNDSMNDTEVEDLILNKTFSKKSSSSESENTNSEFDSEIEILDFSKEDTKKAVP